MILDLSVLLAIHIFVVVAKFLKFEKNMPHAVALTAIDKATSVEDCQAKEPTKKLNSCI